LITYSMDVHDVMYSDSREVRYYAYGWIEIEMNEYMEDTQDYVCSISTTEFELFCMELLKN